MYYCGELTSKFSQNLSTVYEKTGYEGCLFRDLLQISLLTLQVQSCKLYINKYMIVSTQIINTEIFTFTAVLVLS